jgi:O-antigen/teichoic acid export membrane protein
MNKQQTPVDVGETSGIPHRSIRLHGIHSLVDQAVVSVASFVTMVLVGRVGKEELGIFALGISSFWLLAGIANALVWTPYTARAAHMSEAHRKRFRGENAGLNFAIAAILALLSLLVAASVWVWYDSAAWLVSFCVCFAPLLVLLTMREYARRVYIADFEGGKLLGFDVAISFVMVALVMISKQFDFLGSETAMLLTAAAALPAIVVTIKHIREGEVSALRIRQTLLFNWPYSKWLLVVAISWLASDGVLRWMLAGIQGQEAMGAFAGAFLIVSLINPILLAMTSFARSLASRKLATGSRQQLSDGTIRSVRRVALFATLACCGLHFWGDTFMVTVLGQNYSNPTLVTLLAFAVCLELVVVPIEAAFVALEFGSLMSLIAVGRLLASIALGILLIPLYGVYGAAWAMLGRSLVATAMYALGLLVVHRNFSMPIESSENLQAVDDIEKIPDLEPRQEKVERAAVST